MIPLMIISHALLLQWLSVDSYSMIRRSTAGPTTEKKHKAHAAEKGGGMVP